MKYADVSSDKYCKYSDLNMKKEYFAACLKRNTLFSSPTFSTPPPKRILLGGLAPTVLVEISNP